MIFSCFLQSNWFYVLLHSHLNSCHLKVCWLQLFKWTTACRENTLKVVAGAFYSNIKDDNKTMLLLWILAFVLLNGIFVSGDRMVRTASGKVRGTTVTTPDDGQVESFLGIPFAEPPVGNLRFQKPIPITPWEGEYNATVSPPPCYQNYTEKAYWTPDVDRMTEDCLFLNIWVPGSLQDTKPKAVFVWIHGGGFIQGSSAMDYYNGALLASHGNIIVASLNYRLGVFGFLTTPIPEAAGNMGMYDQILALKWIKANIGAFGGDPELITLAGQSAGAMSVSIHLMSPLARGLAKRFIMESGGMVIPILGTPKESVMKTAQKFASVTGCSSDAFNLTSNPKMVVDCLKSLPPNAISEAQGLLIETNPLSYLPHNDGVLTPHDPKLMLADGQFEETEVLIGGNKDEGSIFLVISQPEYFGKYGENAPTLRKQFTKYLIKNMFSKVNENNIEDIVKFYVEGRGNRKTQNKTDDDVDYMKTALYDSVGDYITFCPAMFQADFMSTKSKPVYFYFFTHRPEKAFTAEWMGVTHAMELAYVFGRFFVYHDLATEEDKIISRRVMDRWISFVKVGNPNVPGEVEWTPYKWYDPVYLDINVEEKMRKRSENHRCEFWRDRFGVNMDRFKDEIFKNSGMPSIKAKTSFLLFVVLLAILVK